MLAFNLIMALSFLPVWPVIYFTMRNNIKAKKNIILGVTLPQAVHSEPEVTQICDTYKKWLNITLVPLLPLVALGFFFDSMGLAMTYYMTYILVLIFAPNVAFAVCRSRLLALKREKGWHIETAGKTLANVKTAGIPVFKINTAWFALATAVSLIPVIMKLVRGFEEATELILYVTFAATTLLFWLIYYIIYHVRTDVFSEDMSITMALTRVRRYNWGKMNIIAAWLTAALNIAVWLLEGSVYGFLGAIIVYAFVLVAVSLQTELSTRTAQQKLTAGNTDAGDSFADEDELWILGLLYYNPNDKHLMVNDRVGMNMTMNIARPAGKITMVFVALTLVAMPFIGPWMMVEENTPTSLIIGDGTLTARHTTNQYTINLADIQSAELLTELPYMNRTNGTGMANLSKGHFTARGYGRVLVCLQPQNPPFLVITADGNTYFINDNDGDVTIEVYEIINRGR